MIGNEKNIHKSFYQHLETHFSIYIKMTLN